MENYINYKWLTFAGLVYGRVSVYDNSGKVLQSILICPELGFSRDIYYWEEFFENLDFFRREVAS